MGYSLAIVGVYEGLEQENIFIWMLGEETKMENLPASVIKSKNSCIFRNTLWAGGEEDARKCSPCLVWLVNLFGVYSCL